MLRQRSRRLARALRSAVGWLVLSLLYAVAAVLNVLLALDTGQAWSFVLAAMLGMAAVGCLVAAVRDQDS